MKEDLKLALEVLQVFKTYACGNSVERETLDKLQTKLYLELDSRVVNDYGTKLIEELIDDILFLKYDVMKYE